MTAYFPAESVRSSNDSFVVLLVTTTLSPARLSSGSPVVTDPAIDPALTSTASLAVWALPSATVKVSA